MKVRIGSYDVEISATDRLLEGDQTLHFLNELSIVYKDAGIYNEENHYPVFAYIYSRIASDIFKICAENGLYEELE